MLCVDSEKFLGKKREKWCSGDLEKFRGKKFGSGDSGDLEKFRGKKREKCVLGT